MTLLSTRIIFSSVWKTSFPQDFQWVRNLGIGWNLIFDFPGLNKFGNFSWRLESNIQISSIYIYDHKSCNIRGTLVINVVKMFGWNRKITWKIVCTNWYWFCCGWRLVTLYPKLCKCILFFFFLFFLSD